MFDESDQGMPPRARTSSLHRIRGPEAIGGPARLHPAQKPKARARKCPRPGRGSTLLFCLYTMPQYRQQPAFEPCPTRGAGEWTERRPGPPGWLTLRCELDHLDAPVGRRLPTCAAAPTVDGPLERKCVRDATARRWAWAGYARARQESVFLLHRGTAEAEPFLPSGRARITTWPTSPPGWLLVGAAVAREGH